jgi:hypothetical protein
LPLHKPGKIKPISRAYQVLSFTSNFGQTHAQYLQTVQQIRQLTSSGQQEAAIALSTGREPGKTYWVFDQLRDVNEKARKSYEEVFDQVTKDAFRSLDGFEIRATISILSIALLILFRLRPRLREYFL